MHIDIKNVGRALAKFPYVILSVNEPYYICAYGYDGNGSVGLARLKEDGILRYANSGHERGYRTAEYGSQGDIVIHSGTTLTLTQIKGEGVSKQAIESIKIGCRIAAEGLPLTSQEYEISADKIMELISSN